MHVGIQEARARRYVCFFLLIYWSIDSVDRSRQHIVLYLNIYVSTPLLSAYDLKIYRSYLAFF